MHTEFCSRKPLGNIHLEYRGDGKTRLRWIEVILVRRGQIKITQGRVQWWGLVLKMLILDREMATLINVYEELIPPSRILEHSGLVWITDREFLCLRFAFRLGYCWLPFMTFLFPREGPACSTLHVKFWSQVLQYFLAMLPSFKYKITGLCPISGSMTLPGACFSLQQ